MQPNSLQCRGQPVIFRSLIFRRGTIKDVKQLYIIHLIYTSSITSPLHNFLLHEFPWWYLLGYLLGQVLLQIQVIHSCPMSKRKTLMKYHTLQLNISTYCCTSRDFFSIDKPPLLADYRVRFSYFQLTPKLLHSRLHGWHHHRTKVRDVDPNPLIWREPDQSFSFISSPLSLPYAASSCVDGATCYASSKLPVFRQAPLVLVWSTSWQLTEQH